MHEKNRKKSFLKNVSTCIETSNIANYTPLFLRTQLSILPVTLDKKNIDTDQFFHKYTFNESD